MRKALCFGCLIFVFLHEVSAQKIEKTYLNKADSTSNLYVAVYPDKLPLKGFLFLIPGFGETPENVLFQTDLPKVAAQNGILTIIPTFKTGVTSLGVDDLTQTSFLEILEDASKKYKLESLKLYVGGFSIGGTCAVKFAELAVQKNYKYQPKAVFAIDPPLDFERFHNAAQRTVRLAVNTTPNQESVYMIDRIEKEMKGSPEQAIANYHQTSPYSYSDINQTAIRTLVQMPVRIYVEPDVNWWIKERGADYSSMNAIDASCMINELNLLGNSNATLIITKDKGFRKPNNRKHPHSWSIVENKELIDWLLKNG